MFSVSFLILVFAIPSINGHKDGAMLVTGAGKFTGTTDVVNGVALTKFKNVYLEKLTGNLAVEWISNQLYCDTFDEGCLNFDVYFVGNQFFEDKPLIVFYGANNQEIVQEVLMQKSCDFYQCQDIVIIALKDHVTPATMLNSMEQIQANKDSFGFNQDKISIVAADAKSSKILMDFSSRQQLISGNIVISNAEDESVHFLKPLTADYSDNPKRFLLGVSQEFCDIDAIEKTKFVADMTQNNEVTLYRENGEQTTTNLALWIQFAVLNDPDAFPLMKDDFQSEFVRILEPSQTIDVFPNYESKSRSCDSIHHLNTPYVGPYDFQGELVNLTTALGDVIGRHVIRGEYKGKILEGDSFFHIPYAKQTERFEHSEMTEGWEEYIDARFALKYKECPQVISGIKFGNEDCLNLNIYVPGNHTVLMSEGKKLPVMLFFHGGSYEIGTGTGLNIRDNHIYDGTILGVIGEVVVVSASYRLGALGFMNDGEDNGVLEGNYGIRDMILAIKWVKQYIGDYAGDGEQITIFGQSAGSAAVSLIGISPMSEGLIKGVIGQSGAAFSFFAYDSQPGKVTNVAVDLLGCHSTDPTAKIECLRKRDAMDYPGMDVGYSIEWRPTIDGEFLTDTPENLLKERSKSHDLMLGFNSDDAFMAVAAYFPRAMLTSANLTGDDVVEMQNQFSEYLTPYPEKQKYVSSVAMHASLDWMPGQDTTNAEIALSRVATDGTFGNATIEACNMHVAYGEGKSTYMYLFNIKTKYPRLFPDWVYNSHAFELFYIFGETFRRIPGRFFYDDDARLLSVQMMTYWSNFAKSGNPNYPVNATIEDLEWQDFSEGNMLYNVLDFKMNASENMAENYRPYENAIWRDLVTEILAQDDDDLAKCPPESEPVSDRRKKKSSDWANRIKQKSDKIERDFSSAGDGNCDLSEAFVRDTRDGCIRGTMYNYAGEEIEIYLGVPYAEPPVGELRFMEPDFIKDTSLWNGTLDTQAYKPICPKDSTMVGQSEDCLYLNVYRPNNGQTNLPVMVWFHPDIDTGDGSESYEGYRIASEANVIVITVNYRIGILGFLSTGIDGVAGNLGILDQVLALYWVRFNIVNFGGNRDAVTVFGDSDSSEIIGYHAVSIVSNGLFQKVIHQSGAGETARNLPFDDAENAVVVATELSCNTSSEQTIIDCLNATPIDALMAAVESTGYKATVVIDETIVIDQPINTLSTSKIAEFPFLIGITTGEGSEIFESAANASDRESFQAFSAEFITPDDSFTNTRRIRAVTDYEYLDIDYTSSSMDVEYQKAALAMYGDKHYEAPSMHIANISSTAGSQTFVFQLHSTTASASYPPFVGTPHGEITNYIWYNGGDLNDDEMASYLLQSYALFAWTSNPGPDWTTYNPDRWFINSLSSSAPSNVVVESYTRIKYATLWNLLVPNIDYFISCEDLSLPDPTVFDLPGQSPKVKGYTAKSGDVVYDILFGVPYAEPPVGDQRFQASTPATVAGGNSDLVELTIMKPYCIETASGMEGDRSSEDCLYLDIWVPRITTVGPIPSLPTLVWLCNGGINVDGPHGQNRDDDSCRVDGSKLATDGRMIFIKVHYRTGVFGFAAGYEEIPGNAGLSDAQNAVDWVLGNIAGFGGSRLSVAIGGHGFGATLAMHVASNTNAISKVIAQSGALLTPWAYQPNPEAVMESLAARLKCDTDVVTCLAATDSFELAIAATNVGPPFPFGIYIEAENMDSLAHWKLDELKVNGVTMEFIQAKNQDIELLIGMNTADAFQTTMQAYTPQMRSLISRFPVHNRFIEDIITDDIYLANSGATRNQEQINALLSAYGAPGYYVARDIRKCAMDFHTDEGFLRPMFKEIHSKTNSSAYVYVHEGEVKSTRFGIHSWQDAGATFGEDIESLFNGATRVSRTMRRWWGRFVGFSGTTTPLFPIRWNKFDVRQTVMYIRNTGFERIHDYGNKRLLTWDETLLALQSNNTLVPTDSPSSTTTTTTDSTPCPTHEPNESQPPPTPEQCAEPEPLGTGIGLSLTPEQADTCIEVLFGLALSFACIIVLMGIYFCYYKSKLAAKTVGLVTTEVVENSHNLEAL